MDPHAREREPAPVLLYDGSCGLCNRTVRFILGRDRRGELRFAALESSFGRAVRERHPELASADSLVWVDPPAGGQPERGLLRSDAALRVAEYLGRPWSWWGVLRWMPRDWRDVIYNTIARHRHRFGSRTPACVLPPQAHADRFDPME